MTKKMLALVVITGFLFMPVLGQVVGTYGTAGQDMGNGNGQGNGQGNKYKKGKGNGPGQGFNGGLEAYLLSLPKEKLSVQERKGLLHMREEEKLARDVYLSFSQMWGQRIFANIAQSEQRHMDAVKVLLDKYELKDPIKDDTIGVFSDPTLQGLYTDLVNQGSVSLIEALRVGATIEDLDIYDLQGFLNQADNKDVKTLYQNLLKGSRNHMRGFVPLLESMGEKYVAQYLTQEEVDEIAHSEMERGIYDENGEPLFGKYGW